MKKSLKSLPVGARIVIGITPEGKITSRVHGITGPACAGFLDSLEDLFGVEEHGHTEAFDATVEVPICVGT